jgi:hypothetical protein
MFVETGCVLIERNAKSALKNAQVPKTIDPLDLHGSSCIDVGICPPSHREFHVCQQSVT